MAETLRTEYQVVLTRVGDGALEAATQLQTLQQTAGRTQTAVVAANTGLQSFTTTTKATAAGLRAMQGTLTVIGLQTLPGLTMGALAAKEAVRGLGLAAAATGASMKLLVPLSAAALGGLYEVAQLVKENIGLFQDTKALEASRALMMETAAENMARSYQMAIDAVVAGRLKLSEEEAKFLDRLAAQGGPENLRTMQGFLRERMPEGAFMPDAEKAKIAQAELQAFQLNREHADAQLAYYNQAIPLKTQELMIQRNYNDEVAILHSLSEREIITQAQLRDMTTAADTQRMRSLTQLKGQLTDLQKLGQQVEELFAQGLAHALVQSFKEGGKALQEFFAQFMLQVAEMILKMAILNALNAVFGSYKGQSEGGMTLAARGGFFPRYAAAGIQTVSSPTYFPKFNVLAGEAGREMLTVLARPRFMELGGMEAVVGSAQGQRLAITNADQLAARGGAGGQVVIEIRHSQAAEARIIESSVKGAVIKVTEDMGRDTRLSRTTRQVVS